MVNWEKLLKWSIWGLCCIVLGLLQIWIMVIFVCWDFGQADFGLCFDKYFYKDGVVLFFCSGIIAACAMEVVIKMQRLVRRRRGWIYAVIHFFIPLSSIIFISITCYKILMGQQLGIDYDFYMNGIFIITILYCLGCRYQMN